MIPGVYHTYIPIGMDISNEANILESKDKK